jgi:hypothetical protein
MIAKSCGLDDHLANLEKLFKRLRKKSIWESKVTRRPEGEKGSGALAQQKHSYYMIYFISVVNHHKRTESKWECHLLVITKHKRDWLLWWLDPGRGVPHPLLPIREETEKIKLHIPFIFLMLATRLLLFECHVTPVYIPIMPWIDMRTRKTTHRKVLWSRHQQTNIGRSADQFIGQMC